MANKKTSKKPRRARKKPTPRRKVASNEKPDDVVIIEKEGDKITGVTSTVRRLKVVIVDYLEDDEDDGTANFKMGGLLAVRTVYQAKRVTKEIVQAMIGPGEPLDEEEWGCLFCGETFDNELDYDLHECPDDEDDEDEEDDG